MPTNGLFVYLQDSNLSLINHSINSTSLWILKHNKENTQYFLQDIDISNNTYNRDSIYIIRNAHISVYETIRENRDDVFHVTFEIAVIDKAINSGRNRNGKAKKKIRNHDAEPNIVYIHTYFDANGHCLAESHLRTAENLSSDKAAQLNAWIDELDINILNNFKELATGYAQSYMHPVQEAYNFQVAQLKQRCYELNIFSKESWQDYLFQNSEEISEKLNIAISSLTQLVNFNIIDPQHNYKYYLKLFNAMQRWLVAPVIEPESNDVKDSIEEPEIDRAITIQEDATITSSAKIMQKLNEPILAPTISYQQRIQVLYESCQELFVQENMKSSSRESDRDYALMLHEKVENLYVATFNAYDEHNVCLDVQQIINSFDLEAFIKQKNTICTNILFDILIEEDIQPYAVRNLIHFSVMLSPLQLNVLIERGRTNSLKLILDYRCDILDEDINRITSGGDAEQLNPLLLSAFIYRKSDIFQLLLNKNASPLFEHVNGFSLAHYIITQASSEEHELFAYRLWVQYPKKPGLAGYYKFLYAEITRALQDNSLTEDVSDNYKNLQEEYALHITLSKRTNAITQTQYNNAFLTGIKSKFLSKVHEKLKKYRSANFEKFSQYLTTYSVEDTDIELFQKMRNTHNLLLRLTIEDLQDTNSYYEANQKLLELQMGSERWEELILQPHAPISDQPALLISDRSALQDKRSFLRNYCEQTAYELRMRIAEYNINFSDQLEKMFALLEMNGVAQRKRDQMHDNIITKYNACLEECKRKISVFSKQYNHAVNSKQLDDPTSHIFEELFELIHEIEYAKKSMNLFCRNQYKEYHKILRKNRLSISENGEIPVPFTLQEIPEDFVNVQNQVLRALT